MPCSAVANCQSLVLCILPAVRKAVATEQNFIKFILPASVKRSFLQFDKSNFFKNAALLVYSLGQDPVNESTTESNVTRPVPQHISKDGEETSSSQGSHEEDVGHMLIMFTNAEIEKAVMKVQARELLGTGGFGRVYRGRIDDSVKPGVKAIEVAIKGLEYDNPYQGEKEWQAELTHSGGVNHPNIVKLVGYCYEHKSRVLLYEYMAGGSVDRLLFNAAHKKERDRHLTWRRRMQILLESAKGLAYLHNLKRPLIHRDFKTANILLDEDYNARVADFGLARNGPEGDKSHVTTSRTLGTRGYADPHYIVSGQLTKFSDVYAFGVVIFEMITSTRAEPPDDKNGVGAGWVTKLFKEGGLQGQCSDEAALDLGCVGEVVKERPVMDKVVEILEKIIN